MLPVSVSLNTRSASTQLTRGRHHGYPASPSFAVGCQADTDGPIASHLAHAGASPAGLSASTLGPRPTVQSPNHTRVVFINVRPFVSPSASSHLAASGVLGIKSCHLTQAYETELCLQPHRLSPHPLSPPSSHTAAFLSLYIFLFFSFLFFWPQDICTCFFSLELSSPCGSPHWLVPNVHASV